MCISHPGGKLACGFSSRIVIIQRSGQDAEALKQSEGLPVTKRPCQSAGKVLWVPGVMIFFESPAN